MAKKALISTIEPAGKDDSGYRVLEVVEVGQEFEIKNPPFEWIDCPDTVEGLDKYWYNPSTNEFKKTPLNVPHDGTLAKDANGMFTEKWLFNWDTETWSKISV